MDRFLNSLLVTTIEIYQVWCVMYLFPIDMIDEKIMVFFISVKENGNRASDWLTILDINFFRYLLSSYYITRNKYSKCFRTISYNRAMVSLYSMCIAEDNKTKCISNPFFDWYAMIVMYLNIMMLFLQRSLQMGKKSYVKVMRNVWMWVIRLVILKTFLRYFEIQTST